MRNPGTGHWGSPSVPVKAVIENKNLLSRSFGPGSLSHTWSPIMEQIAQSINADTDIQGWPEGFRLIGRNLNKGGKLCVPEEYVREIVRDYHFLNGHIGVRNCSKA